MKLKAAMKFVPILLIVACASNTVVLSAARCSAHTLFKINHTGKHTVQQKLTMDDPAAPDDRKALLQAARYQFRILASPFIALIPGGIAPVDLGSRMLMPATSSLPHLNIFSEIFIPPK